MHHASDIVTLATLIIGKQAETLARHRVVRNLFSHGGSTPVAPHPMHPSAPAPNAETPLPRKTAILCNAYIYTSLPCSYADPC